MQIFAWLYVKFGALKLNHVRVTALQIPAVCMCVNWPHIGYIGWKRPISSLVEQTEVNHCLNNHCRDKSWQTAERVYGNTYRLIHTVNSQTTWTNRSKWWVRWQWSGWSWECVRGKDGGRDRGTAGGLSSPSILKENLGRVCGRTDLSLSFWVGNDSGRCYKLEPSRDTDSHQQQSINPYRRSCRWPEPILFYHCLNV